MKKCKVCKGHGITVNPVKRTANCACKKPKKVKVPKSIKNLTVAQWKMRLLCKLMGLDYKLVHKLTK